MFGRTVISGYYEEDDQGESDSGVEGGGEGGGRGKLTVPTSADITVTTTSEDEEASSDLPSKGLHEGEESSDTEEEGEEEEEEESSDLSEDEDESTEEAQKTEREGSDAEIDEKEEQEWFVNTGNLYYNPHCYTTTFDNMEEEGGSSIVASPTLPSVTVIPNKRSMPAYPLKGEGEDEDDDGYFDFEEHEEEGEGEEEEEENMDGMQAVTYEEVFVSTEHKPPSPQKAKEKGEEGEEEEGSDGEVGEARYYDVTATTSYDVVATSNASPTDGYYQEEGEDEEEEEGEGGHADGQRKGMMKRRQQLRQTQRSSNEDIHTRHNNSNIKSKTGALLLRSRKRNKSVTELQQPTKSRRGSLSSPMAARRASVTRASGEIEPSSSPSSKNMKRMEKRLEKKEQQQLVKVGAGRRGGLHLRKHKFGKRPSFTPAPSSVGGANAGASGSGTSGGYYDEDEEEDGEGDGGEGDDYARSMPTEEERLVAVGDLANSVWNEHFQRLMSQPVDSEAKFHELAMLAHEVYGKIIISEQYIPVHEKTIKPLNLGGIAGGDKYVCRGILFKYAIDKEMRKGLWMYGDKFPNHAWAMKAAGHELRSLARIIDSGGAAGESVAVPLMTLIDYRGYRLVAMSLLPVAKDTLCYGSSDGGITVHADYPAFNAKFRRIFQRLNLKAHRVKNVTLYSCGDIEGHWGSDGKLYLLDFARLYPPESVKVKEEYFGVKERRAVFYKLLRPELVASNTVPLCSDAFTGWLLRDSSVVQHNNEVTQATRRLMNHVIPQLASRLQLSAVKEKERYDSAFHQKNVDAEQCGLSVRILHRRLMNVLHSMHACGVNRRYLGVLRTHIGRGDNSKEGVYSVYEGLLLTEMLARVCKDIIRALLREKMKELRVPSSEPYRQLVLGVFNLFSGASIHSYAFWTSNKPPKKLHKSLHPQPGASSSSISGTNNNSSPSSNNATSPPTVQSSSPSSTSSPPSVPALELAGGIEYYIHKLCRMKEKEKKERGIWTGLMDIVKEVSTKATAESGIARPSSSSFSSSPSSILSSSSSSLPIPTTASLDSSSTQQFQNADKIIRSEEGQEINKKKDKEKAEGEGDGDKGEPAAATTTTKEGKKHKKEKGQLDKRSKDEKRKDKEEKRREREQEREEKKREREHEREEKKREKEEKKLRKLEQQHSNKKSKKSSLSSASTTVPSKKLKNKSNKHKNDDTTTTKNSEASFEDDDHMATTEDDKEEEGVGGGERYAQDSNEIDEIAELLLPMKCCLLAKFGLQALKKEEWGQDANETGENEQRQQSKKKKNKKKSKSEKKKGNKKHKKEKQPRKSKKKKKNKKQNDESTSSSSLQYPLFYFQGLLFVRLCEMLGIVLADQPQIFDVLNGSPLPPRIPFLENPYEFLEPHLLELSVKGKNIPLVPSCEAFALWKKCLRLEQQGILQTKQRKRAALLHQLLQQNYNASNRDAAQHIQKASDSSRRSGFSLGSLLSRRAPPRRPLFLPGGMVLTNGQQPTNLSSVQNLQHPLSSASVNMRGSDSSSLPTLPTTATTSSLSGGQTFIWQCFGRKKVRLSVSMLEKIARLLQFAREKLRLSLQSLPDSIQTLYHLAEMEYWLAAHWVDTQALSNSLRASSSSASSSSASSSFSFPASSTSSSTLLGLSGERTVSHSSFLSVVSSLNEATTRKHPSSTLSLSTIAGNTELNDASSPSSIAFAPSSVGVLEKQQVLVRDFYASSLRYYKQAIRNIKVAKLKLEEDSSITVAHVQKLNEAEQQMFYRAHHRCSHLLCEWAVSPSDLIKFSAREEREDYLLKMAAKYFSKMAFIWQEVVTTRWKKEIERVLTAIRTLKYVEVGRIVAAILKIETIRRMEDQLRFAPYVEEEKKEEESRVTEGAEEAKQSTTEGKKNLRTKMRTLAMKRDKKQSSSSSLLPSDETKREGVTTTAKVAATLKLNMEKRNSVPQMEATTTVTTSTEITIPTIITTSPPTNNPTGGKHHSIAAEEHTKAQEANAEQEQAGEDAQDFRLQFYGQEILLSSQTFRYLAVNSDANALVLENKANHRCVFMLERVMLMNTDEVPTELRVAVQMMEENGNANDLNTDDGSNVGSTANNSNKIDSGKCSIWVRQKQNLAREDNSERKTEKQGEKNERSTNPQKVYVALRSMYCGKYLCVSETGKLELRHRREILNKWKQRKVVVESHETSTTNTPTVKSRRGSSAGTTPSDKKKKTTTKKAKTSTKKEKKQRPSGEEHTHKKKVVGGVGVGGIKGVVNRSKERNRKKGGATIAAESFIFSAGTELFEFRYIPMQVRDGIRRRYTLVSVSTQKYLFAHKHSMAVGIKDRLNNASRWQLQPADSNRVHIRSKKYNSYIIWNDTGFLYCTGNMPFFRATFFLEPAATNYTSSSFMPSSSSSHRRTPSFSSLPFSSSSASSAPSSPALLSPTIAPLVQNATAILSPSSLSFDEPKTSARLSYQVHNINPKDGSFMPSPSSRQQNCIKLALRTHNGKYFHRTFKTESDSEPHWFSQYYPSSFVRLSNGAYLTYSKFQIGENQYLATTKTGLLLASHCEDHNRTPPPTALVEEEQPGTSINNSPSPQQRPRKGTVPDDESAMEWAVLPYDGHWEATLLELYSELEAVYNLPVHISRNKYTGY